ncbi:MAG: hypothetical protein HC933_16105 [Pleurocapsa sp. SU_196_0]|nr:hypothetical protein [Pleurocapsa sp. SU_196_0]
MSQKYALEIVQEVNQLEVLETIVEILEVVEQGPPGTSFNPRGAWGNTDTYQRLDVVVYNGSGYAALAESTGVAPGSNAALWKLLVSKGDAGDVGGSLPWSQITGKPVAFPSEQATFNIGVASTVWSIAHGMNKRPNVKVKDTADNWYLPDVEYLDLNALEIRFAFAVSGTAYLD